MRAAEYDLSKAMGKARIEDKVSENIMDVVGADVDGEFKLPIQYFVSSSVAELSICGQTVTSGNMMVNIRDDNVLLDIHRSAVQFTLTLPANTICENFLQLFQPVNAQIGEFQWSVADGGYLVQQKLYSTSKDDLRYCARGIGLPLREYQENMTVHGTHFYYLTNAYPPVLTESRPLVNLETWKFSEMDTQKVANNQYVVSIPLAKLFPFVEETFKDGYVYLGLGQSFVGSCEINPQGQYLCGLPFGAAGAQEPTISQAQLFKVYVELDAEKTSDILRSSIPIRKVDYLLVKEQLEQSVVLNYNLNEKQRAQRIYIAAHWNAQSVLGNATENVLEGNEYTRTFTADATEGNLCSGYKAPLNYMTNVWRCLALVQLNFGGHVRTINAELLHALLTSGDHTFQMEYTYDSQVSRQIKQVMIIDLRRFGVDDLIGSSSGNQQSVQLQLVFDTSAAGGQIYPGVAANAFADGFPLFSIESFLETSTSAEIVNGIYKIA